MSEVYVYGLMTAADARAACAADPSGRLTSVPGDAVAAVCEPASRASITAAGEDGAQLAALARRHDAVVNLLAGYGPTLPVRMGTCCTSDRLAPALIAAEADLLAQLDRLRGCSEWRLRVRPSAAEPSPAPSARSALTGTEYLLQRQARQATTTATAPSAFADVDAVVAEFSSGNGPVDDSGGLRSRSYLIEDARTDALFERVNPLLEQATARGDQVTLTGPLPAYSFADVELGGTP